MLPLLASIALFPAPPPAQQDLAADLAALVDVPRAEERRNAALELAADDEVSLEEWLTACRAFSPRGEGTRGQRIEEVSLWADGEFENTPVAIRVPQSYRVGTPAPLLMVFHWTGGRGEQALGTWVQVAEELGMLLCAPSETGPNDGYRFSRRERDVALSALRWMRREFDVDENRIFATGVSRGGHLTWEIALRHTDLLAGAAPMIGGPYFDIRAGRANMRYLENLVPLPFHDLQGAQDQAGLVWNVRYAFERLEEFGAQDAHYHEFPDLGHSFAMEAVDWKAFFTEKRRDPRPKHVVRRFARPGEGRAYWVEVLEQGDKVQEEFEPTIARSKLERLDQEGQRRWMIEETDKRTGRIDVRFVKPGRVEVRAKGAERFRLLLTEDMFEPGKTFEVKVGSRRKKSKVRPSKETLLVEFAERFDRSFLPVGEVIVGD